MKMLLVKAIVIGMGVFICGSGFAAELTLDDCIDLALKNRYSIIAARGREDIAAAGRTSALGAFLPRVSAAYNYGKTKGPDVTQYVYASDTMMLQTADGQPFGFVYQTDSIAGEMTIPGVTQTSKSMSVSAGMDLFDASNFFNYAATKADKARAHLDVIASEQDLILSVKIAYYAYLEFYQKVDVQREAVKRSGEQLKLIDSRFELGSAAKSDVLKQRVQVGNDRLGLLQAENAATTSKASLAYTIGLDPTSDFEFQTTYTSLSDTSVSINEAIEFALAYKPSLLASEKSMDASKHRLRSAKSRYLPTLTGSGSLNWSPSDNYDGSSSWKRTTSYGIGVSWNVFDGFARESQLSSAKVTHNNSRAWLSEARNRVARDVKTAHLDIEKTNVQSQVAAETVEAAAEDLKITQEKYDLGAATILDLLNVQVSHKTAQVSLIEAGFDHNLAIARLENAMGKM